MAGSRRFGSLAFAKQTGTGDLIVNRPGGTGVAAANPLFQVPVLDGQVGPAKDYGDLPRIGSTLARLGRFAQRARTGGTVQMLCHPEALGLLLYNCLGGYARTTGAASPAGDLHRFTMTDVFGPPLTVWSSVGNQSAPGAVWRSEDCFVQRLSIQGSSGENVIVEAEFVGFWYVARTTIPALATGPPAGVAEDATPRMKFIGSTVKLDPVGTSPTQVVLPNSIDLTFDRAPELRYGTSLTPVSIAPDRMVNASFGMDFDDAVLAWNFLTQSMTGQTTIGGVPEQGTARGSFDVTFGRHPVSDNTDATTGAKRLQVVSGGASYTPPALPTPQANWEYTMERPAASGEPDALTYDLDGQLVAPTSGTSEVNVLLTNDWKNLY